MPKRLLLIPLLALVACQPEPAPPFGTQPVTEPTLFAPGVVSTGAREYAITFSRDGREAYFTRSSGGRGGRPRIMLSRVVEGAWTEPEPAPFSTGWEESPFLTPEGDRLFFSSRQNVPGWGPVPDNSNIWVVQRRGDGWSAPMPLAGEVNKPRLDEARGAPARNESGAIVLSDGTLLYSTQEEPEHAEDIYVADQVDGRFVNARPLLLNSSGDEASPTMSPDGRFLVFHGFRDVLAASDDLFLSERTEYGWSDPRPLPEPINSPFDEGYASFSPDGRYLFFSSDRGSGGMSIYYVGVEALGPTGEG